MSQRTSGRTHTCTPTLIFLGRFGEKTPRNDAEKIFEFREDMWSEGQTLLKSVYEFFWSIFYNLQPI